ncbi:MAG: hypothetical protein JW718_07605 [Desulfovibrionaceae bacterium]|nr:hypothetical protein [Desulfovibrionaceae bacterium]
MDLLKRLTPRLPDGASRRSKDLLPSLEVDAPCVRAPSQWAEGWAFAVGSQFQVPLDCTLTRRMKKQRPILEWTQGSLFNFQIGHTIHGSDPRKPVVVQVHAAIPAAPASAQTEEQWPSSDRPPDQIIDERLTRIREEGHEGVFRHIERPAPQWELRRLIPRNPGFASLAVYLPNDGPKIWRHHATLAVSQDEFVRVLIVGLEGIG